MKDVINEINKKYVRISNRVTKAYEKKFALPCDIYFPIFPAYSSSSKYRDMKIFTPHQSATYSEKPDIVRTYFYIPFLIKKDAMNSSEMEFDSFYTVDEMERPFIETTKKRELPIGTKVVVYQGQSIIKFFVDKKLVITGADGMMLLRMYLAPLAKDDDGEIKVQEETEVEGDNPINNNGGEVGVGSTIGSSADMTITGIVTTDSNISAGASIEDDLEMIIPDEDE
jgi:hypothetical protein